MIHEPPRYTPIILSCATLVSTGLGGMAALRFRHHLYFLLGFGSGAVIAVALFDLLPEIFKLGRGQSHMPVAAAGFLAFFALERYATMHRPDHDARTAAPLRQNVGVLSAGGLCAHSFLDGVAIRVGFEAREWPSELASRPGIGHQSWLRGQREIGLVIAGGVIAHDVSDGLNTVTVCLAHRNSPRCALLCLIGDMLAPVLGTATALMLNLDGLAPWVLAFFAGSFLYIGASHLLPEAQLHDSPLVGVATAIGMLTVFVTTRLLR